MRFGFEEGAWLLSRELLEGGPSGAEVSYPGPTQKGRMPGTEQPAGRGRTGEVLAVVADQMWGGNGGRRKVTPRCSSSG